MKAGIAQKDVAGGSKKVTYSFAIGIQTLTDLLTLAREKGVTVNALFEEALINLLRVKK